jgi:ankyrin repeat protein
MSSKFRNKRRSNGRKTARTYNRREKFKNKRTRKMRGGTLDILMRAIDLYDINGVKSILNKTNKKRILNKTNKKPVINDIENGMTPLFKALTKHPADEENYNTIKEIIGLLIDNNADVNKPEKGESIDGTTPLMMAIINYDYEIIKLLIVNGADVNAKNKDNDTPLTIAIKMERHVNIINLLIENGADVNADVNAINNNETPLSLAIENKKYSSVIKLLIEKGANVDNLNEKQKIRLGEAVEEGDEEMIGISGFLNSM